jgi:hypothetical protein
LSAFARLRRSAHVRKHNVVVGMPASITPAPTGR